MIAQLLDRDFVLGRIKQAAALGDQFGQEAGSDRDLAEFLAHNGLTIEEVGATLNAIGEAAALESARPAEPIENEVYITKETTVVNLFQSALEQYYEEVAAGAVLEGRAGRDAAASRVPVTDRELADADGDQRHRRLFDKFSVTDVGWAIVLVAQSIRGGRGRRDFKARPAEPVAIGNRARLVLVADWATGIPRARKVGATMRQVLFGDGVGERHVIHLGDVYYSGWRREYERRFLQHWPVRTGEEGQAASWCLNGNHDMYSGGFGYYDYLLADPRFRLQQQSSFFSLHNDHWHILGLDTAYQDEALKAPQPKWIEEELTSSGLAGLLLSHHQPFSAYDPVNPAVHDSVRGVLDRGLIRAWFWGHEHRCALYEARDGVAYPRCIGHGGVPAYAPEGDTPETVAYEFRDSFSSFLERWSLFGFAVLDLEDDRIHVRYIDEDGRTHHEETLTAH